MNADPWTKVVILEKVLSTRGVKGFDCLCFWRTDHFFDGTVLKSLNLEAARSCRLNSESSEVDAAHQPTEAASIDRTEDEVIDHSTEHLRWHQASGN